MDKKTCDPPSSQCEENKNDSRISRNRSKVPSGRGTSPPTKTRRMGKKNGLVSLPIHQTSTKAVEVQTDPVRILPFDQDEFEEEKRLLGAIHTSVFAEFMAVSGKFSQLWEASSKVQPWKDKYREIQEDLKKQVSNLKEILSSLPTVDERKEMLHLPPKSIRIVGLQANGEHIDQILREAQVEACVSIATLTPKNVNTQTTASTSRVAMSAASTSHVSSVRMSVGQGLKYVAVPKATSVIPIQYIATPKQGVVPTMVASVPGTLNNSLITTIGRPMGGAEGVMAIPSSQFYHSTSASVPNPASTNWFDLADGGSSLCAPVSEVQSQRPGVIRHEAINLHASTVPVVGTSNGHGSTYIVVTKGNMATPIQHITTPKQSVAPTMVTSVLGTLASIGGDQSIMTIPSQAYTSTSASVQILRQPPPFPPDWCQLVDPSLPQPQVSAFISGSGVKVQWTVAPGVNLSTVASYEIFSYHEAINDPGPSPWTRLGDVTSLILPMSVTLEKMLKGKTYHFIVRAMNALRQPGPLSKAATLTVP